MVELIESIRSVSNFRVACQFYQSPAWRIESEADVARAFRCIVEESNLHSFLVDTFDRELNEQFKIEHPHEHCKFKAITSMEPTLARAAANQLGAYSGLKKAKPMQIHRIKDLFSSLGPYVTYELMDGNESGCNICGFNSRLYSNWFYDVAWDWTYFVTWPLAETCLMICMTDTD